MSEHDDLYPMSDPYFRTNADGYVRPFSVKEQWEQVRAWQSYLKENPEVGAQMSDDWALIQRHYTEMGYTPPYDWHEFEARNFTIIEAIVEITDWGFFVPPELMTAFMYTFKLYMHNEGKIGLEEAFFGPPVKRAGNYAARDVLKKKKERLRLIFVEGLLLGMSRTTAAERACERLGGMPDTDSILRMMRKVTIANSPEIVKTLERWRGHREEK